MRLPTFSVVGRAVACPASAALPQIKTDNVFARDGRGRHAFVSRFVNLGRDAALADVSPEQRAECEAMQLETLLGFFAGCGTVRSEVAFAYDPETDTARELGENIERKYEEGGADMESEICGALDLHARVLGDDEVRIVDMKGRGKGDPWQLKAQAIAVARHYGVDRVTAIFAHHQPDGSFTWDDIATYEALDLDEIAAELRHMKARVTEARAHINSGHAPDVFEGDGCTYCPALRYCPAKTALVRSVSSLDNIRADARALTMPERATAWLMVKTYKPLLEAIERSLKELAAEEPIDLGTKEVRAYPGNDQLDAEIGRAVIAQNFGDDKAEASMSKRLTKAGIEKALGDEAARAIEMIRNAGGITTGAPIVKEVRKPKKRSAA